MNIKKWRAQARLIKFKTKTVMEKIQALSFLIGLAIGIFLGISIIVLLLEYFRRTTPSK